MRGLEGRDVRREEEQIPDPVFEGPQGTPRVGIVAGGLGSRSLVQAVGSLGAHQVALVEGVAKSSLAPCEALLLPERRIPATFTKQQCWLIWDWVAAGGRLILTHDAVGYRNHPILFPWVCSGGTAHVEGAEIDVVWAPEGSEPAGIVRPSFREHVLLQPCIRAEMTLIAADVETGKPTVTGAMFETGKVLACGVALGVDARRSDAAPNPGEMKLLGTMLAWLMQ
ncbi:MAG: hypothetical protein FJX75_23105 [Armatimonadetes bacterium]|nr:hypothetical protein [Armatimonadota bacterium]